MGFLSEVSKYRNESRHEQVKTNKNYEEELKLLENQRNLSYYLHIISNVEINRNNENNSYIMWVYDKVDTLDVTLPSKIRPGRCSLPDIDCDFPISKREYVIEYIKNKYGIDKVSQISTYSRMQGRSAMKDVLNAHSACSFDEMNKITEFIPDEAAIADQLQEMIEEDGHASIIQWALENNKEQLKEWAYIDDNGEIQSSQGNYGNLFAQAIRLEGTKRSQGKHAAGVVISSMPLHEVCPMIYDKNTGQKIAAMEMSDLEAMGQCKMDVLGVAALEKLMLVKELLEKGFCE